MKFCCGRRGVMLMEMLVAISLMAIILGAGAIAFHDVMKLSRQQARYQQRRIAAEYFLRCFAKDVRGAQIVGASTVPQAGPALAIVMADGGKVRYFGEGNTLQRSSETTAGNAQKMPLISDPGMTVRFDAERRDGDVCSVVATVEWEEPPETGVSHPVLSLRVALGGKQ